MLPQRLISRSLEEIVARRAVELTAYQDAAYAERYKSLVERAMAAESAKAKGMSGLAEATARYYYKLLAYKDEYEVARLFTDGTFTRALNEQFEGDYRLEFHSPRRSWPSAMPRRASSRSANTGVGCSDSSASSST